MGARHGKETVENSRSASMTSGSGCVGGKLFHRIHSGDLYLFPEHLCPFVEQ